MDVKQLLPLLAQMQPADRLKFAAATGIPQWTLEKLESVAESMGMELAGGRSSEIGPDEGGAGSGPDGETLESDDGDDARPSLAMVLDAARQKFWALAGTALFFGSVPLVLFIMRTRRGLSWRELATLILRLPFSD
jgi:hypothetical protein